MTVLIARSRREHLRASVVVPCSHEHIHLLPELFDHLGRQYRKPDEILLALSGCEAPTVLPPGVRLLHSAAPRTAGQNRNRGSDAATGDVLIYQDADDIPHPQRIEIVAGLFEAYEIEHLMHGYVYTRGSSWSIRFPDGGNKIFSGPPKMPPSSIKEAAAHSWYRSEPAATTRITNGEIATARSVFSTVRWPERAGTGTDVEYNQMIYSRFKRTVTTDLPLVIYRHNLSSFR